MLLPVALAAAVYLGALHNPFVYDDVATVVKNPSLRDLSNWRFVLGFSPFRPLVNLSYAVDTALWGLQPYGFHLTGLLLHALDAALFWLLASALLRDQASVATQAAAETGSQRLAALGAACLFAVHPMMTEAVGYASARGEVLCAALVFACLLFARRAVMERRRRLWVGAALCWLLALASRENAAMVPLVFLAWDRLLQPGSQDERRRRLWRLHLPLVALVAAGGAFRLAAYLRSETAALPREVWRHFCTELPIYWRYLRLLLWPAGQSLVHPAQRVASPLQPAVLLAAAGMLAAGAAAWMLRRRFPLAVFGLVWFPLFLAPSSSLIPLVELMAEHRVYLASCGLFLIAGLGFARLDGWWRNAERQPSLLPRALGMAAIALLAVLTMARNEVWADPVTLWADAARKAPLTWAPYYALGDALRDSRGCRAAVPIYRRAVELRPDDNRARLNLGICLAQLGEQGPAKATFEAALALDPRSPDVHNNLGWLANLDRQPDAARQHFQRALEIDPKNAVSLINLATLDETVFDDPAEALRLCRELQRLHPGSAAAGACVERNERRLQAPE